jgi:molecular chaperone GrpE
MSTENAEKGSSEEKVAIDSPAAGPSQPASAPGSPESEPATAEASEADAEQALQDALSEVARIKDQLLRTAADFDNFRKRSRREMEDAERRGREELVRELLPVFDNLERAVVHAGQASDAKSVADGVSMVLRQFVDTLGRLGIKRIEALGVPFDPARHEAVQQIETDKFAPGTVAVEIQPGYMIGDKLLRAAMVVVAKPAEKTTNGSPGPEPN